MANEHRIKVAHEMRRSTPTTTYSFPSLFQIHPYRGRDNVGDSCRIFDMAFNKIRSVSYLLLFLYQLSFTLDTVVTDHHKKTFLSILRNFVYITHWLFTTLPHDLYHKPWNYSSCINTTSNDVVTMRFHCCHYHHDYLSYYNCSYCCGRYCSHQHHYCYHCYY